MKINFFPYCLFLLSGIILNFPQQILGQCQGGYNYGVAPITPGFSFTTYSNVFGGEYIRFNATVGNVYEFSYCTSDGGSTSYDTELSINTDLGVYVPNTYNNNTCGTQAKVTWTPSTSGIYRIITTEYDPFFLTGCYINSSFGTNLRIRQIQCVTPANGGTLVGSRSTVLTNDTVSFNLTGYTGTINWEFYYNSPPWTTINNTNPNPNFFVGDFNNSTLFVRARLINGGCIAYSNTVQVNILCGVPFNTVCNTTLDYISNVSFNTINNNSTYNNNTAYQNFSNLTTSVCKGSTYNLSIASTGVAQGKTAWIDYNNDGDFNDPGENVLTPTSPSTSPGTGNVTIPGSAITGSVRMRVLSVAGIAPNVLTCAATYYPSGTNTTDGGEYEDYTINILATPTAAAGASQTLCATSATMAATNPTPNSGTWSLVSGSGSVTSTTLFNSGVTGLGSGANVFLWTVSNGVCTATSQVTLTNQTPTTANAGSNQSACSLNATLAGNSPSIGTGNWSLVSGTGSISNSTLFNSGVSNLGSGANVFLWTITNGACLSTSSVTITNNIPNANAGSNQTICSSSGTFAAVNPTPSTGSWSLVSGTGSITTNNLFNSGVTGLGSGANTFLWTVNNGICTNTSQVTINNQSPSTANAGGNQTACSTTATLAGNSPSIGTGNWTLISGSAGISNSGLFNSGLTGIGVGPNVLQWTITNGACSSSAQVTITNNTPTTALAGSNQTICTNSTTLAGNTPTNGTGVWSVSSGSATITNNGSPTSGVTAIGAGTNVLIWGITTTCGTSTSSVTIVNDQPTTSNAGIAQTVCTNTATLAANTPVQGTGAWSLLSGSGSFASPNSPSSNVTGVGLGNNTYQWTITQGACTSTSSVQISYGPPSSAVAGASQTLCTNQTIMAATAPSLGTGTWSLLSGNGTLTNANSATTSVTNLGAGTNTFLWTVSNTCGSSTASVNLVNAVPSPSVAGADQTLCVSTSASLNATPPVQGTGTWSVISGTGTFVNANSPTTTVNGLSNGNNQFLWTVSTGSCSSTSQVNILVANGLANAQAGADQTICGSAAQLNAVSPSVGSGSWSVISGGALLADNTLNTSGVSSLQIGSNVFQWTVVYQGCVGRDTVRVLSEQLPTGISAGPDQGLCLTQSQLQAQSPTTGVGAWSVINGTATIQNPLSATSSVSGLSSGNTTLRWTVSNSCGTATDDVVLNVGQNLSASSAGADQTVCGDSAFLGAVAPINGIGTWSQITGGVLFTNSNQALDTVRNLSFGSQSLIWTVTYGLCTARDTVVITRNFPPTQAVAGPDQQNCSATAQLAGNTPVVGQGTWIVVGGSVIVNNPSSPTSGVTNLSSGTNTLRWYISNGNCPSNYDEVLLIRNAPGTQAVVGNDIFSCATIVTLSANTPTIGTGQWSTLFGSGIVTNFTQPNAQAVGITIGDSSGFVWTINLGFCATKDTLVVTTVNPPVASFTDTLIGTAVHFTNSSLLATHYEWNFDDGTVSTLVNPIHQFTASGVYQVRLVAFGPCENDTTYLSVPYFITDNASDIETKELFIRPNPAETFVTVTVAPGVRKISITEVSGRIIETRDILAGEEEIRFSVENLPRGIYWIEAGAKRGKVILH